MTDSRIPPGELGAWRHSAPSVQLAAIPVVQDDRASVGLSMQDAPGYGRPRVQETPECFRQQNAERVADRDQQPQQKLHPARMSEVQVKMSA